MALIEKYIAKRINKDTAPDAIYRDGNRMFLPGDVIDALNCRYSGRGKGGKIKSVPGNTERFFELPDGNNVCIGTFLYSKVSTVIYCIWNDNLNHMVIEWNPDSNVFTTLLAGSFLNFSRDHYVCQGGVIDDIFIFNDRLNYPRCINIVKAKSGFYGSNPDAILLAAIPPLESPTFLFVHDVNLFTNYLIGENFQFSYRFIYYDFRYSTLSPYSKLAFRPSLSTNFFLKSLNAIDVTVKFPTEMTGIVSSIEFLFRKGNAGNFAVFKKIDNPSAATYTARFTNSSAGYDLSLEEQNRLFDDIPDRTNGLELMQNRVFVVRNKNGFDVDESLFNLTISLGSEVPAYYNSGEGYNVSDKLYLKNGGKYSVAILLQDKFGKTSFVKSNRTIDVPFLLPTAETGSAMAYYINWALSGVAPAGFERYQLLLTTNNFQSQYFQCKSIIHMYIRELREGESDNVAIGPQYYWRGRLFSNFARDAGNNLLYTKLFVQIPLNVPFIPDNTCYVKFEEGFPIKYSKVVEVIGDFIVIENNDIDWAEYQLANIEIFKPSEESTTDRFYEIGVSYPIVNGMFSQTSGRLDGDTYRISMDNRVRYRFTPIDITDAELYLPIRFDLARLGITQWIESKTAIYSGKLITVNEASVITDFNTGGTSVGSLPRLVNITAFDLTKADSHYGRVHTLSNNKEESANLYSVVGWSSLYIQNSKVNGLSSFSALDHYNVPIELGPVNSLKRVKNVLVASHDRETSTLYIHEGIMKQGDSFTLLRVTDVVGDDQELERGSGCINPESMYEVDGTLFWWDAYRGEVSQYTKAGIWPISAHGMTNYFYQKSLIYYPHRHSIKIVTGYDFLNDEFIISFPAIEGIIEAETWAFDVIDKEWKTRYSFHPDQIFSVSKNLFTFKEGQLWVHHDNPLHNNFYGQQFERSWRFVCNPQLGRNKKYLNVHIDGDIGNGDPDFVPVRVYTKEGQETFIPAHEFTYDEGKWCGPILRDVNTPGLPTTMLPLLSGDEIVSNYAEIEIINNRTDEAPCSQVNVVFKEELFSR